ncbi:MAG TPA: hypothetical protein VH640_09590 [Bryobacteraceae bacterium]
MEAQTKHMENALAETRKSADAAIVSANAAKAGAETTASQMALLERQTTATEDTAKAAIASANVAIMSAATAKQTADVAQNTLESVRDQAKSAQLAAQSAADNAASAKATAETLINSERAWMTLEFHWSSSQIPVQVYFRFKNSGRTPAWITECKYGLAKSNVVMRVAIDYEKLAGFRTPHHQIVAPGDFTVKTAANLGPPSEEEDRDLEAGSLILYFYGLLGYRDITGSERNTRFCYKWVPGSGWAFAGSPEANRCD